MIRVLMGYLLLASPAVGEDALGPATTDRVTGRVGNIIPMELVGIDDWNLTFDGTVFCQSDDNIPSRLIISNPAWASRRSRGRDDATLPSVAIQVFASGTTREFPFNTTGTCLVVDRQGLVRALRYELSIEDILGEVTPLSITRLND